jgi:tRNA nucleotidyltransferase (CCA-adding enzyme)
MKEYLKKLPKEILDLVYSAQDVASSNNMPVYLVGGFVRDLMLGVKNLDLDIVVEGDGIKFADDFASALKAKLIRHQRFGTATIILKPHLKIDISTARKEFYPEPAHLPVVSSGTLKDDLFRRDFTINAMAISISCQDFGKLIDIFDGKPDLDKKKIRVLHDLSFIDDPTRILRAIRFEKRYGFKIEANTLKLLKGAVKSKMLEKLEPQRTRDDLILMLKEEQPLRQIKRLHGLAGLEFISKRLSVTKKTYKLLSSAERQINWFRKVHHKRRTLDTWLIYFMGLIDNLDIKTITKICYKFALRRGDEKRILQYKRINHKFVSDLGKREIKPSKIFAILEPLTYEVILLLNAKFKNRYLKKHIDNFFRNYNGMRILVSGHDLKSLGVSPGPDYQKIFAKVLNEKLEGRAKTKDEELQIIKKLLKVQ